MSHQPPKNPDDHQIEERPLNSENEDLDPILEDEEEAPSVEIDATMKHNFSTRSP